MRAHMRVQQVFSRPILVLLTLALRKVKPTSGSRFSPLVRRSRSPWAMQDGLRRFLATAIALLPAVAMAQQTVPLPAGWQQMSPGDFAAAMQTALEAGKFKAAPDQALAAVSQWAGQQADLSSAFTIDAVFEADTRDGFRLLAYLATQELPGLAMQLQLQKSSLQLPDGRCCLPVADILAVSYLAQGELAHWIAWLDGRLADTALTGDLRVNWLLARSFAEEIRLSTPNFDFPVFSRPLDGRGFLDEAYREAQSPANKLRVLKEIAARLAWSQQYSAARMLLQRASSALPSAQQATLASWQQQIAALMAAAAEAQQKQAAGAQQAYIHSLSQRRDQAAARGNTAAVSHYTALLTSARKARSAN
jgi:hypothetical protein